MNTAPTHATRSSFDAYGCVILYMHTCMYTRILTCAYNRYVFFCTVCLFLHKKNFCINFFCIKTIPVYATYTVCMYICMHACVCLCVCTHAHTHIYTYTYIHIYMHRRQMPNLLALSLEVSRAYYRYMRIHEHITIYKDDHCHCPASLPSMVPLTHYTYIALCVCVYIYIHTYIYIYIHTYIYIYMHICI